MGRSRARIDKKAGRTYDACMRLVALLAVALIFALGCESAVVKARRDLGSDDPDRLIAAAEVLGKARDKESVPRLCELLEDEDAGVREAMCNALGDIGDERAAEPLAALYVREENREVARGAVRALVDLGRAAAPVLVPLLRHRDPERRAGAARALGKLRAREAVDELIRLIDDRDEEVRMAAIHALRQIGDARGMDAIARALEDPNVGVQEKAESALSGEGYQEELNRAKRLIRSVPGR
jgi:HEAT repeat protein